MITSYNARLLAEENKDYVHTSLMERLYNSIEFACCQGRFFCHLDYTITDRAKEELLSLGYQLTPPNRDAGFNYYKVSWETKE